MVEQNARQALAIADRGFVLVTGQNRFTDSGQVLLANEKFVAPFLVDRMDFLNAIVLLSNYVFIPSLVYGSQLALVRLG